MAATVTSMIVSGEGPPMVQSINGAQLGCNMRLYTYKITQTDEKGMSLIKRQYLPTILHDNYNINWNDLYKILTIPFFSIA